MEQVVDGIEPFNAGLEVKERVCREVGRELGGVAKLLFVMYLFVNSGLEQEQRWLTMCPRR